MNTAIKELQANYDPDKAMRLVTEAPFTASELAENHLFMALRSSRVGSGVLTLEDIARIIRESLEEDAEFVGKKLLIKEN